MRIETERKCPHCNGCIILENYDSLFYRDRFWHPNCFIEKLTTTKRNAIPLEEAKVLARQLQIDSRERIKELTTKHHLYTWLQSRYDVVSLPKSFFEKMASIYNGSYRGLSRGIPVHHIFDMWKRKRKDLAKINNRNKSKGKIIENISLIHYDLAILMNRYDSYLKWLKNNKIIEAENKQKEIKSSEPKINFEKIGNIVQKKEKEKIDISKIVDEV